MSQGVEIILYTEAKVRSGLGVSGSVPVGPLAGAGSVRGEKLH